MAKSWLFDLVHYPYDTEPENYDPKLAAECFDGHLREWERAEELGYDGLFLGEHHFTPYNMTPSPNVMLAAIAARTQRMRLGIMANILPFHQPLRLAEEIAMLDLLTHGRLECGLGRGVDEQEFLRFKMPYEDARPRFEEGLELMLKAWKNPVFSHEGRFFNIGEATIYPRPLQQPHPPIWITSLSPRTIQWSASQGFPMSSIFLTVDATREAFDTYEAAAREAGQPTGPSRLALARNVFIADTMEEAKEIARPALDHLFGLFMEAAVPKDLDSLPAEYAYYQSFFRPFVDAQLSFDDLCKFGLVIIGTPESVRDDVVRQVTETRCGHFISWQCFGNLSIEHAMRSQELYAKEVLPALHELA